MSKEIIAALEKRRAEILSSLGPMELELNQIVASLAIFAGSPQAVQATIEPKIQVLPKVDGRTWGEKKKHGAAASLSRLPLAEGYGPVSGKDKYPYLKRRERDPNSKAGKVRQAVNKLIEGGAKLICTTDVETRLQFMFGKDVGIPRAEIAQAMRRMKSEDGTLIESAVKPSGEILYRPANPVTPPPNPGKQTTTSSNMSPFAVLDSLVSVKP